MVTLDTRLQLARDVTFQSVADGGDDTVILSLESGHFYTCNETTAAFLEAADGLRTLGEIIDALLGRFDVSRGRLQADLTEIADKLLREKLIVSAGRKDDENA